ncbi:hypothetical protein QL285_033289 [Trifolium repens]|nr:hypothetical protein QL285_033289 [Trifolium repens]
MKILYWNLRGFGNPETRLALKNYCLSHKPDVVFLAEPMIAFDQHNSDHHPLLVGQDLSGVKHPAPFRFFRAWTSHADCVRVVKEVWAEPVHGSPMVCLQAKLKRLKAALKEWNLTVFGNMDHNVTSAIDEVNFVQALIDENGITDALQQLASDAILHSAKLSVLVNGKLAVMCRARFLKWGQPTNTFLKSSFWHGIKHHVPTVKANTRWIIGSGTEISFWLDNWLSEPLVDVLNLPISAYPSLTARLSSFIVNGEWNIPTSIVQRDSTIRARIDNVVIPQHAL